eukprot:scaffold6357_cov78-Skeletonema_dohrnii-CCMP3373.AAC.1
MGKMFYEAYAFNRDLSAWDTSSVTNMAYMSWNTSSVTNMYRMFYRASAFNQSLCAWKDNFPYSNAAQIFVGTNCPNKSVPVESDQGPFCAGSAAECKAYTAVTPMPTKSPTTTKSPTPTKSPTNSPTKSPTNLPTKSPTNSPTKLPTNSPTNSPTKSPTNLPTNTPTNLPANSPTNSPTPAAAAAPISSWALEFVSLSSDFDNGSESEVVINYKIGAGRTHQVEVLKKGCEEGIIGAIAIVTNTTSTSSIEGDPSRSNFQVFLDIQKDTIANSNIIDGNILQLCIR